MSNRIISTLVSIVATDDVDESRRILATQAGEDVPTLVAAARAHGVEAWLASCLPAGDDRYAELVAQRPRFLAARARQLSTAKAITAMLAGAGIDTAILKGPSIAGTVYPRPDMRHGVDLDLLVRPGDLNPILDLLAGNGYDLLDTNWPLIADLVPGELRVRAPNSTMIDLHWHLLQQPDLRREFSLPTDDLLDRARPFGDGRLFGLDPVAQLVHVALHATLSGANRLLWMVDIDRLARAGGTDWPEVIAYAKRSRTGLPVAVALAGTRARLGTPVPTATLRELAGGRAWLTLDRLVRAGSPLRLDPSKPATAVAFARSTRSSAVRSQSEFVKHGLGWLRSGAPRSRTFGDWLDPDSVSSALHPVADDQAKTRYLTEIRREGAPRR